MSQNLRRSFFLFGGLLTLAAGAPSIAAEKAVDCCREEKPATPLTRGSIYQLEAAFTDDTGESRSLESLRGQSVVLNLFYASCGYACPIAVSDMLALQARVPANLRSRTVFVLVSFDTTHDTTAVLAEYRKQRGLDAQWILLRGTDDSVRELAALVGVKYKPEPGGAFAHSNLITILNPEGEIVHQRIGLNGGLAEAAAALGAPQRHEIQ